MSDSQVKQKKDVDDLGKFQSLPPAVQDFIEDPKISKINLRIIKEFDLSIDQEDLYFDLTDRVFFKKVKVENFLDEVKKIFKFDEEKSRKLSLEVLGNVLLPLDSYLGNVSTAIKKIGGDPNKFEVKHMALQKISAEKLRDLVVKDVGFVLKDEASERRLKNIIINKFNDVRDDNDTIEVITRGAKTGGMGLTPEVAKKIVEVIDAKKGAYKISKEVDNPLPAKKVAVKKGNDEPPSNLPIATQSPNTLNSTPNDAEKNIGTQKNQLKKTKKQLPSTVKKKDIIYGTEDEREIEYFKTQLEKKIFVEKAIDFGSEVKKGIENILTKGKLSFRDEDQKTRFVNLASARLRDVRDKNETLDLLKRDRSIGGLGLKEDKALRLVALIEEEFKLLNKIKKEGEIKKIDEWKKKQEQERKLKAEKEESEENKKLEDRWTKLTGKPADAVSAKPIKETEAEKEEGLPVVPEKLAIEPPAKRVSVPQAPTPKPQVETVSKPEPVKEEFTPRLVGPIEELRRITITDFRRLSEKPELAIEKIKDKIELLEDESYTKRIQGIRAWQESEPAKIYFEVLSKSINEFIPIPDILADRVEKKLPSLSQEEFNALMKLNKSLRV